MSEEEKTKKAPNPEAKARRKAVQAIGFTIWRLDWSAAHPKASREDRKKAWEEVKGEELKKARKVMGALEKAGFKLVRDEKAAAAADEE